MFIKNLKLDVIATFENHEQEWFVTSLKETTLKSEKNLLNYIKKQLSYKDLIKLSLCWYCEKDIVNKYKVIQESIKKKGKYFFDVNTNKLIKGAIMGFDICGLNPKNEKGEYFRNNVWYWRPLAQYVLEETKVILEEDQEGWHYNDCHEVSKEDAEQIAKQLDHLVKSGHCKNFAQAWEKRREKIEKHNKQVEKELEEHCREVCFKLDKKNLAPKDFPKEDQDKWEEINNKRNSDGSYPFTEENVKEFSEFCKNSGGFTIG